MGNQNIACYLNCLEEKIVMEYFARMALVNRRRKKANRLAIAAATMVGIVLIAVMIAPIAVNWIPNDKSLAPRAFEEMTFDSEAELVEFLNEDLILRKINSVVDSYDMGWTHIEYGELGGTPSSIYETDLVLGKADLKEFREELRYEVWYRYESSGSIYFENQLGHNVGYYFMKTINGTTVYWFTEEPEAHFKYDGNWYELELRYDEEEDREFLEWLLAE